MRGGGGAPSPPCGGGSSSERPDPPPSTWAPYVPVSPQEEQPSATGPPTRAASPRRPPRPIPRTPPGCRVHTWDWRRPGGAARSVSEPELPGLEEPEPGGGRGEGARRVPPRPFRVLSLASSDSVRGRARGRGLQPAGGAACGGGPSKRESHGGQPRAPPASAAARRVRMSVTASMSSEGSIAAGKDGQRRGAGGCAARRGGSKEGGAPHGHAGPHGCGANAA